MPSDISALMSVLSCWENAGYVGLAIVIIGVAGESTHELTQLLGEYIWWRTKGGKASALVLITGLVIAGIAQVKANAISGQIIAFLNAQAADLNKQAVQLRIDLERERSI